MVQFRSTFHLGHLRRRLSHRDLLFAGLWGTLLACLEVAGRSVHNDFGDAVLLAVLAGMVLTTLTAHRATPLALVHSVRLLLRQALGRCARQFLIEYGVDLRQTPPIRRGFPSDWSTCLIVLSTATLIVTPLNWWWPGNLRDWIAPWCYVAYLLTLGVLWGLTGFTGMVMGLFAWTELLNGWSLSYPRRLRPVSRRDHWVLSALAGTIVALSLWASVTVAFVLIAALQLIVVGSLLLTPSGLILLWRPKAGGALRSFDGRWGWLCLATVLTAVVAGLAWLCAGDDLTVALWNATNTSMPLSRWLGALLAWSGVAGLTAVTWQIVRFVSPGILHNPAVPPPLPTAADAEDQWRLQRQWEIRQRRALTRGLEKLFKQAARWDWQRGSGFWIGLQHWFIYGLTRDEDENGFGESVIGRPYHRMFPREARYHYRQIMQALNIDLVYVEDGVPFRRFVRVLRVLFEVYDMHGGRQPAEDRHFLGLPGVRVLLENYELGTTTKLDLGHRYREPDYEEIGRARLMLVLKDRGEDVDRVEAPDESTGTPVFSRV